MRPAEFLLTSGLLGLLVLCAGGYGLLHAVARLKGNTALQRCASISYAIMILVAGAITLFTPLGPLWKSIVIFSAVLYFVIPPLTWRHLEATHRHQGGPE